MTQLSTSGVTPEIGSLRLCFYGAGSMAEAICTRIVGSRTYRACSDQCHESAKCRTPG